MHVIVQLLLCSIIAVSLGCSGINTRTDFDRKYNFKLLKVYEWLQVSKGDNVRHIDVERVRRAVNKDLKFKGFQLATGPANFLIALSVGTQHRSTVVGANSDWDRFSGGAGPGGIRLVNYEQGTLKLDFIDRKSMKIFWQGEARAVLSKRPSPRRRSKPGSLQPSAKCCGTSHPSSEEE